MATVEKVGGVAAPDWAMQRAQGLVSSGETILAVWTISDENRENSIKQPLATLALLPCFWPHAICCAPCICSCLHSQNEAMKTMVYVLTDKRLYQSLDKPVAAVCITQGVDSGDVELKDINSVGQDMPGMQCGKQCFPTKFVVLGLPMGHPLAKLGGGNNKHTPHTKMALLVDDPAQAATMIREAKDKSTTVPVTVAGAALMPMQMERPEDPAEATGKLKSLVDAGAITQEEFDSKKAELLSRI